MPGSDYANTLLGGHRRPRARGVKSRGRGFHEGMGVSKIDLEWRDGVVQSEGSSVRRILPRFKPGSSDAATPCSPPGVGRLSVMPSDAQLGTSQEVQ